MDTININRQQLEAVLLRWEQAARRGECESAETVAARPAEQVAAENAAHLWGELSSMVSV